MVTLQPDLPRRDGSSGTGMCPFGDGSALSADRSIGIREDSNDDPGEALSCTPVRSMRSKKLETHLAEQVAEMAITTPEVLRVTRAYQVFENCAEAFRSTDQDLHHKSRKSQRISRFWSHSWHGSAWAKVLTLFVLYNGLASVVLGTVAAFLMMCLFSFQLLPGFDRAVPGVLWSIWSMASGLGISITFCLLGKPRQEVFFDRVCISRDSELKSQAIFSLAGMLKNSKEMLILWDQSWSQRLWCLFELAAFLQCKKGDREKVLIIRPTIVGPCSITAFLAVYAGMLGLITVPIPHRDGFHVPIPMVSLLAFGGVAGFFTVMTFRAYFRSLQILEEMLRSKTFDTVNSSCCDMNHVDTQGCPLICDREVVEQCVSIWFGSIEAFERSIRSELREIVTEELRQNVFTQGWVLQVATPILWGYMDIVAVNLSLGFWEGAIEAVVYGLVLWQLCAPMFLEIFILLTRRYCSEKTTWCCGGIFCDFLLNIVLLFVLIVVAALMGGIYLAIRIVFESRSRLFRALIFLGTFLSMYIITYALKRIGARCQARKKFTTNTFHHEVHPESDVIGRSQLGASGLSERCRSL